LAALNEPVGPAPQPPALLFQRLRWRLLRNAAASLLQGSALRVATIVVCSVLVWACVFGASRLGFQFLQQQRLPFLDDIVGTLFDLFFLALALMLMFSTGIILYSSLFASAEAGFLLSTPAPADRVFAYKYQGALAFSSWAFVLLGSASLIGYGLVFEVPWTFYALLPLFLLGFILVPGSAGALVCLLLVNIVPRRRKQVIAAAVLLVVVLVALWGVQMVRAAREAGWTRDAVKLLLGQFDFARGALMPSHWVVRGLLAAKNGDAAEAASRLALLGTNRDAPGAAYQLALLGTNRDAVETAYRLALLWANGLGLYVLTAWVARRVYRRAYNRVATGGSLRRRYGGLWVDQALGWAVGFLHPQVRLLLIKDFRTFRRDPAQWVQILIFTCLLCLYFANTRRFYEQDIPTAYQNGVSLLNLAATAVLLCAWTGRFIYPLLSLEGRKFWILGLLPLQRDVLLWGKFAFSATGAVVFAEFLVVLSDLMLAMPAGVVLLHALTVVVLAAGLSGLSVGIGAWMPNFRETDPSKIAIGFGGTLNLIASLLFLGLVIGLMTAPWHLVAAFGSRGWGDAPTGWLAAGVVAGVLLGLAAVVVPLQVGARTLRRMEF
jgi:ABC-2 type transport system permease protein